MAVPTAPLVKVAKVIMGQSPPGDTYNKDGDGIPLLNGPTEFGTTSPTCTQFTTGSRRECEAGDLIFCVRGSTTGRMNWADRKYSLGRGVCSIRGETAAETRFVSYCIQDRLHALLQLAGGGTFPNLTKDDIEEFEIPWPDNRVRIANILSAYDELMENCQRRTRLLEAMARALYCEWFVHFHFPGHEKHPRVVSPLGDIPQGWKVEPLESLMIDHIGGGWGKEIADEDHTEPAWVIRGTDIPDARSSRVADVPHRFHTVSNLRTRRLQAGDILFEVSGGSKAQPVGRTLLVTPQLLSAFGDESVICASFCKRVRPDAVGYGSELLYLSFLEGYESGEIEQFQVQSTGISNFKWTEYIAKTERVIPPTSLRERFRDRVAPLFSQIATLGLQIQSLRRMRDLLLPRLLSGRVNLQA